MRMTLLVLPIVGNLVLVLIPWPQVLSLRSLLLLLLMGRRGYPLSHPAAAVAAASAPAAAATSPHKTRHGCRAPLAAAWMPPLPTSGT